MNKSIDYGKNETGKNDSLKISIIGIREKIDSINENANLTYETTKESTEK